MHTRIKGYNEFPPTELLGKPGLEKEKQEHALANVFNEPVKNLPGQVKEKLPLFYLIGSQLRYDSLQKVFIHVSCVDTYI